MTTLDAKQIIGAEQGPSQDGPALAAHVVKAGLALDSLVIDVSNLAPEDLVSSFVNAFLHALQESGAEIAKAGNMRWVSRFESEAQHLMNLVALYLEDVQRTSKSPPHGQHRN